jgi:4-amino-4-deoxy-L-arabinose transferase-like glycosyltransferase
VAHPVVASACVGTDRERGWSLAIIVLLVMYAGTGLALVSDYGITYDEEWHGQHGTFVLDWYTSGFADRTFERFGTLRFYGVLFDLPAAMLQQATGADPYAIRHLLNLGFAVAAAAGIARLALLLNGPAAGFFAALTLILTPRFFGHGFNNGKDLPLAAATVWAVVGIVRFTRCLPRPRAAAVAALGVPWGLALAVRLTAFSLVAPLGAALAAWWFTQRPRPQPAAATGVALRLAAAGIVAALVALPFWPFLILHPVGGLGEILDHQWKAGLGGDIPVLYDGRWLKHAEVPATYVWRWLAMVTPEFCAVGILCGGLAAWRARPWSSDALTGWSAVLTAAMAPLLLATLTRPALYDGLRHFLFATVFLAVPAGAGWAWCARRLRSGRMALAGFVLVAAGAGLTLTDMVRLHPYQTAWFNRTVAGGLAGAAGRWDTDYWGNSFREGALWLARNAPAGSGPRPSVASSAHPAQVQPYLPEDRFEYLGSVDQSPELMIRRYANPPDYYISFTRWGAEQIYPGEVIHRVMRDGVTLLVVVKVDREKARNFRPPPSPWRR